MLKKITQQIGAEVKDSTVLMNNMNDTFENTKVKLRGTMDRMLRMASKSGIGWKVWVIFILGVFFWTFLVCLVILIDCGQLSA